MVKFFVPSILLIRGLFDFLLFLLTDLLDPIVSFKIDFFDYGVILLLLDLTDLIEPVLLLLVF